MLDSQLATKPRRRKQTLFIGILVILLLLATSACVFFFMKYQDAQAESAAKQRSDLVATIGKAVLLPAGEEPGLSTVIDKSKLSNPTLRERAKNGDKLLIYTKAGRLIIYRPSTGKVVDMLTIQNPEPVDSKATTPSEQ